MQIKIPIIQKCKLIWSNHGVHVIAFDQTASPSFVKAFKTKEEALEFIKTKGWKLDD